MKYGKIIIEKKEYDFIKQMLSMAQYYKDATYRASISKLKQEMILADVVSNRKMPTDVIRLNSIATIETPWNVTRSYQIVTPEQSDLKNNKISILAPMGLALYGYAKGDEIEWQFPMGMNTIKILEVVQHNNKLETEEL